MSDFAAEVYPELDQAIKTLEEYFTEDQIPHELECSEEDSCIYTCVTTSRGRRHGGMIVWNREKQKVMFTYLNEEAMVRNEKEGVEDGMGELIVVPTIDLFILFMNGVAREIWQEHREEMARAAFGGKN